MMANLTEIVSYIAGVLQPECYQDSSFNGLQVEGKSAVSRIHVAVDAGEEVIDIAICEHSDLLIVHHGLFWGEPVPLCGSKKRIFKKLLDNEISLYASHLPLDGHLTYGNNAALAEHLQCENIAPAFNHKGAPIGCVAEAKTSVAALVEMLNTLPGSYNTMVLPFGPSTTARIGIVSGAGCDFLREWKLYNFDTFITGEPRQSAYHFAKENGLNVIFAGHYRTETLGVQRIGQQLATTFSITSTFIDFPTGI